MKTIPLICMFLLLAAPITVAQTPGQVVTAKVTVAPQVARQNSVVQATVVAEVASGYHINDHHPTLDYLIPTEFKLEPVKLVTAQDIVYPKGQPVKFTFSDAPLSVYEGTVRIVVPFQVERRTPPGNYNLKGQLAYQACNDHACLPPASIPLTFSFKVTRRNAAKHSKHHASK